MRKKLVATVLVACLLPVLACAQKRPQVNTTDPNTGMNSAEWLAMVGNIIDGQALVGVDGVLMVNALPVPVTVTCATWTLVGSNPYNKGNPGQLRPFSVTFVKTAGFDGYCKGGVIGHSGVRTLTAKLDAADGSFSNSTIITFGDQ